MFPLRYLACILGAVALAMALAQSGTQERIIRTYVRKIAACRCFPGDKCWPSQIEWDRLNSTLGGKLIGTVPIGSVCHDSSFGPYDAAKCEALRASWLATATHDQSSSSPMMPYFANMSCDPFTDPEDQCILGAYVQYAVNATTARDYVETLKFIRRHSIRLVVRNTGHDYLGKSTGAGALAIWTHYNQEIDILDYTSTFYNGKALKIGAGVQGGAAQAAAHAAGLVVVNGNCPTVGLAGGFTQGAGLSPISSTLGLSADNVLAWEVVTTDGKHLVATPERHKDLYWALSGGGGGTYAVVLSMTVRAYPTMPIAAANLTFVYGGDVTPEDFWGVATTFIKTLPSFVDAGATVIWSVFANMFFIQPVIAPGMSQEALRELLKPTTAKLEESGIAYTSFVGEFPSYFEGHSAMSPDPGVLEANMGGRLIPRSLLSTDESLAEFVDAVRFITENGALVSGVTHNVAKFGSLAPNAVNPAWRTSIISFVLGTFFNRTSFEANIADQHRITNVLVPRLAALTPGGSAYLNEADFRQPDFQDVFYGANYAELLRVKRKYDPMGLLYGVTAVGSERWLVREDGRLCKV